jgi:hypothetical protein
MGDVKNEPNRKYELEKTIDELKAIGFHYDSNYGDYVYDFPVFFDGNKKPAIICKIFTDEDNNRVCWNVYGTDGSIYPAYYNRQYGITKVVKVIDKNIRKELQKIGAKEKK